ncbi:ATP-binding protein [Duganella aceris]|uniref:Transcriptional regulator n=1 Tax=Duganella aceris TaxID=2703883 RepID=A0ABX0FUY3_9BURK|nr:winged helix-turn-helix domain-containing protein [Duganella aceris]NGZ88526.1 transcriptional regulator [Duganella aceris]
MNIEWRAQFGPFMLSPAERLLEQDGEPVRLGGRALDLLIALVESAGEVVGKHELLSKVWPNMVVEEGNLRFHIVNLRKALGDSGGNSRYIVNVANKGYSFVAPVIRTAPGSRATLAKPESAVRLPVLSTVVLGRDEAVDMLTTALSRYRLVSIIGSGGIGKTTVAIATMHSLYKEFGGDVHFVDFSCISEIELVHATVASAIGLAHCADEQSALEAHLADRTTLIVLDCCEHLIDEVAKLIESILRNCPDIRFLVTSREVLRAAGEYVYRLQPLAFPPDGDGLTGMQALAYPAVKLFVERAAAGGIDFTLSDEDAPLVSRLCRDLEGIALAIELAASRIEALGLRAITQHFDAGASLLWPGRRTASARQQTLRATLDWSFNLLPTDERSLLTRLSVFTGTFSLDAALDICNPDQGRFMGMELVANLVSKSLVAVDAGGTTLRYRMLDTTRSYCRHMLESSEEFATVVQRYANFYNNWMVQVTQHADAADLVELDLPNLRATLDWYIFEGKQFTKAVELAAMTCPLLLQSSQLVECSRWAQAALSNLPDEHVGSHLEMRLQRALGQSLMFLGSGRNGRAAAAYRRSIQLAEQLGDLKEMLHLLSGYLVLLHREGSYTDALNTAHRAQALLTELDDLQSAFIVDSLMGVCLHMVGRIDESVRHWENCFVYTADAPHVLDSKLGFEYHIRALCGLSRTRWLTGSYRLAYTLAEDTILKAKNHGHAVTYCLALIWAGSVYSYAQDVERITDIAEELERVGKLHSLEPYRKVADILHGQVMIMQGHPAPGTERIRDAVESLHGYGYEMVTSVALTFMAKGLSDLSLHSASLSMCDEAEATIHRGGDLLRLPECLTTRGKCLVKIGNVDDAEQSFVSAIDLATRQGAWSWRLRATLALAELRVGQGKNKEVVALLLPLVSAADGENSADLARARTLLNEYLEEINEPTA